MLEQILPLLGKSIDSEEIKELFIQWRTLYPIKTICTKTQPFVKLKMEKDCMQLHFGIGGNSKYLKPLPTTWDGGFYGIFTHISFTKKRVGGIPLNIEFAMSEEEISAIMGNPHVSELNIKTWRAPYLDIYELTVTDVPQPDGTAQRNISISYLFELQLNTLKDYETAGL